MEIEIGIGLKNRNDVAQASMLRRWLDLYILPTFDGRILPISLDVARRCADLHVPDRRPERDALIAASAREHGLSVVTRNVKDFDFSGLVVIDPWATRT